MAFDSYHSIIRIDTEFFDKILKVKHALELKDHKSVSMNDALWYLLTLEVEPVVKRDTARSRE